MAVPIAIGMVDLPAGRHGAVLEVAGRWDQR